MKIGIIGSGDVALNLAIGLSKRHQVMISSRNPSKLQAFVEENPKISIGYFQNAAQFGEIIINALSGHASLEVLNTLHKDMNDKILIDVSNPLDFSKEVFQLSIANVTSLGEEIQKKHPHVKVIKTLNMVTAKLMTNPSLIKDPHDMFICGNDDSAKNQVKAILTQDFGWKIIHDLGDITGARAMEQLLPLWIKLWGNIGHTLFNFHIASNH